MFNTLNVTITDAEMWHLFDKQVSNQTRKDCVLVSLIVLAQFVYVPFFVVGIIALHVLEETLCLYFTILVVLAAFWHMHALNTTRHCIYLAKYLRNPDNRELRELVAGDYFPMKVMLAQEKYRFVRGYVEGGYLCLEFDEGVIPHTIRGLEYRQVVTSDISKQGSVVLDAEGVTVYTEPAAHESMYYATESVLS